jgi:hypothetical protein
MSHLDVTCYLPISSVLNLDTPWPKMVRNGTNTAGNGNGLRHGTGTETILFHARVLTVSCPAFKKFGTARHDTIKALDTARVLGTARNGTR